MKIKRKFAKEILKLLESLDKEVNWQGRAGDYVDEVKQKLRDKIQKVENRRS